MKEKYHIRIWNGKELSFTGELMDAIKFTKEQLAGWAEGGMKIRPYLHANANVTVNVETPGGDSIGASAIITPINC